LNGVDESKLFLVINIVYVNCEVGGNYPGSRLEDHEDRTIRELDTKIMEKILDEYILMCEQAGVTPL
jgi:hypothetical protein